MIGLDEIIVGLLVNIATGPGYNALNEAFLKIRGHPLQHVITNRIIPEAIEQTKRDLKRVHSVESGLIEQNLSFAIDLLAASKRRVELARVLTEYNTFDESTFEIFVNNVTAFFQELDPDLAHEETTQRFANNLFKVTLTVFRQEIIFQQIPFREFLLTEISKISGQLSEAKGALTGLEHKLAQLLDTHAQLTAPHNNLEASPNAQSLRLERSFSRIEQNIEGLSRAANLELIEDILDFVEIVQDARLYARSTFLLEKALERIPLIPTNKRETEIRARILTDLGDVLRLQGYVDGKFGAQVRYVSAEDLWAELGYWDKWFHTVQMMGVVHHNLGFEHEAINTYTRALDKRQVTIHPNFWYGRAQTDIAMALLKLGDNDEASSAINRALWSLDRSNRTGVDWAYSAAIIVKGYTMLAMRQPSVARNSFSQVQSFVDSYSQPLAMRFHLGLAATYLQERELDGAFAHLQKAEKLIQDMQIHGYAVSDRFAELSYLRRWLQRLKSAKIGT